MFFRKYGVAAFIAMTLGAGSAMAADPDTGTITFHGLVSNNTCKISLDNKIDQDGNDLTLLWIPFLLKTSLPHWVLTVLLAKNSSP